MCWSIVPTTSGREAVLKVHAAKIKMADDVDLTELAKLTPGLRRGRSGEPRQRSGTARRPQGQESGLDGRVRGRDRARRRGTGENVADHPSRTKSTAWPITRCGHALVACSLPHVDPVHKISIIPRGLGALGYTMQRPEEDRHLVTQTELQNRICVLLGGIAAEEIVYQETSTGAQNDLERATDIARRMVMEFGMSPKLGRVNYRESKRSPFLATAASAPGDYVHSEQTIREIDLEVKRIIDECMVIARETLRGAARCWNI